jgi:thioredoxin 1
MLDIVKEGDTVLYFKKEGCGPCRKMAPIVEELCNENGILLVYEQFEVDKDIFHEFKVQGLPTVIKLKDGEETGRLVGLHTIQEIDSLIKGD